MAKLSRLQEHLRRREWVHLDREATRLDMMEPLTLREQAQVYRAAGRAKVGLNDLYGAIDKWNKAIPLALRARDWDSLGFVRADLGAAYTTTNDIEAAINQLRAYLLDLDRYTDARDQLGNVRFNLALAFKYRRKFQEAIEQYEAAIEWYTLRGNAHRKAMAHQNLAWLFCSVGRLEDAKTHLEIADTYRESLSPDFDAEQICGWAFYYWLAGRIGDATDCVQEILLADRPGVDAHHRGQAAVIAGHIAVLLDQEESARRCFNQALDSALDTNDPPLVNDCSTLRAAIEAKWGNQEAAQ